MERVNVENQIPPQESPATPITPSRHGRHRRSHGHRRRSETFDWLRRIIKNKRTKKKLVVTVIYVAIALFCFLVGYYYFGPKLTNMGE